MSTPLTLASLQKAGAFLQDPLVEETISWTNKEGEEIQNTIFVKRASFATLVHEFRPLSSEQSELDQHLEAVARRIAFFITDKHGQPVFTTEDVLGSEKQGPICESLTAALLNAITKVNLLGKSQSSSQKKKSGMS